MDTLRADLTAWNIMTLAGRLQKPFRLLGDFSSAEDSTEFEEMVKCNREMAMNFSRLLLGSEAVTEQKVDRKILRQIVQLSYEGDIRMSLRAEAADKIDRIIDGNYTEIEKIY